MARLCYIDSSLVSYFRSLDFQEWNSRKRHEALLFICYAYSVRFIFPKAARYSRNTKLISKLTDSYTCTLRYSLTVVTIFLVHLFLPIVHPVRRLCDLNRTVTARSVTLQLLLSLFVCATLLYAKRKESFVAVSPPLLHIACIASALSWSLPSLSWCNSICSIC